MKKYIDKIRWSVVTVLIGVTIGLFAGYVTHVYMASKEARIVTHMAYAMERDGIIDQQELSRVKRFVSRQYTVVNPAASHERLRRMHDRLHCMRKDYQHPVESRTYHALQVCIGNKMEE